MRNLKKFLALVLATLMIVSAMVATTVSAAEADHAEAVEFLNLINVYLGDGQGMAADQLVTRWQMALFVSRVTTGFTDDSAWANTENTTPFTDVETRHYIGAIACAYNAGIINGVGDNKFAPDANIKYQEALAMAVRALGYTGLSYPLETVQMAQKLGLTDNLNELDNKLETAVTRGQIAEILQNTLLATAKDGTTLLESVFKMDVAEEAVVVATPKQALPGYNKTTGTNVTLAVGDTTITVAADLLLEEGETVEDLLGYSFTLATTNNYETVVNAFRCDSKVIKNLGSDAAIAKKDGAKIKIEGKEYALSAIDVYTLGNGSQTLETKGYYYNLTNDIVDENGEVLLYYINGEYWKNVSGTSNVALVKATDADFTRALSTMVTTNIAGTYAVVNSGDSFTSKYAEMKLFDDNGDGKWDRAIYTPYTLAKITTASETNSYNAAGSSNGSTKKTVMKVDGTALANAAGNKLDSAVITFVGGKPANNEYVIYHYNPNTTTFTTVQNLGAVKTGKVEEVSGRGNYVTIEGKKYNYNLADGTIAGYAGAPDITPAIDALVKKTYNVKYLALGDYVILLEYVTPQVSTVEYTNYVVFGWSDVKGIDSNGNLIVNAIIDATGAKKEIKVAAIDNYKVGLKLADLIKAAEEAGKPTPDAEDKYQVTTGTTTTPSTSATVNYKNFISGNATLKDKMMTNIYAGKVDANGVYTLTKDLTSNKVDIAKASAEDHKVEFKYGINMQALVTAAKSPIALAGKFDTTSKTVYLFVGNDDYKVYTGVAPDGAYIDLTADGVTVYNATESFIFVTTTGKLATLIDTAKWAPNTSAPVTSTKSYYAVTSNTYAALTDNANADVTLTVDNFYNVLTGKYEDLIFEGARDTLAPIFVKINAAVYTTVVVVDGDTVKIDADYNDLAAELNNLGYTKSGNIANNSADKTGFTLKLESVTEEHLQSISLKVFWKDGSVQTIDGKEGYKFAGEDFAYYTVDAKGNLTGFVFAPNAKAE